MRHPLRGWTFIVASAGGEVRITAHMTGGSPAVWFVPGRAWGRRLRSSGG